MKLSDYDFDLPIELIAQHPLENRTESKLLVLNDDNHIEHKKFSDIIDYLQKGDVLVRNNTKVIPARIFGLKDITNAKIELLLLKETKKDNWEAMVKPAKRIKLNDKVIFGDGILEATCIKVCDEGIRVFEFAYKDAIFLEVLEQLGTMPLPPYIHEKLEDQNRYQTVYNMVPGSVAAPTAGLHFTDELLEKIKANGIDILDVTLTVGLGTFKPVNTDNILDHNMHSEQYSIDETTANLLNKYKKEKRRIVAVGTTSIRSLEANFQKYNEFKSTTEDTDIFIYPGYEFKAVDALITNFHLPKSTLMMLVSALKSRDVILKTYGEAIENSYRFFSFGDSMFINNKKK